ncbi:MAG: hypothetical protein JW709_08395, partial [Sedimentisphaerales bacterium]|nr:hypothetical protein [Sedimentisphaerales bacterium]
MKRSIYLTMAFCVIVSPVLYAAVSDPNSLSSDSPDEWSDIKPGEGTENLLFMEIPVVISASRQEQRIN